jgi:Phage tail assembly chaperone proteins, E, or 41 or 14
MSSTDDLPITKTIVLATPIKYENQEYAQLVLREPRAKEVLQADEHIKNGMNAWTLRNRQLHLVAKVAAVPFPVIEQLPISALNNAMAYIDRFLVPGQETGES